MKHGFGLRMLVLGGLACAFCACDQRQSAPADQAINNLVEATRMLRDAVKENQKALALLSRPAAGAPGTVTCFPLKGPVSACPKAAQGGERVSLVASFVLPVSLDGYFYGYRGTMSSPSLSSTPRGLGVNTASCDPASQKCYTSITRRKTVLNARSEDFGVIYSNNSVCCYVIGASKG